MQDPVVIVAGVRTPMGGMMGVLSSLTAPELGAQVIRAAVERSGLTPEDIEEVLLGCVLPAGMKQGPARQAMIAAGLPLSCGATTINKLCGSGMKAVMLAQDLITAGSHDILLAGGMESMSNAPHLLTKARGGYRLGHGALHDHMFLDGLEDPATGKLMGVFAQETADQHGLTRDALDAYAMTSLRRALEAIEQGKLKAETLPVTIKTRKGETCVDQDEQPFQASLEKIPSLRPAFKADGTLTAANSSSISDGASALILTRESVAKQRNLQPMARLVAHTTQSQAPADFTLAPIGAIEKLLKKTGWQVDDVDLFEINEAFATVPVLAMNALNIPLEKTNIYGGACAQGHPVGSTGSRLIVTLMHALKQEGGKKGIASLCIGGGEATAVAIELI